MSGDAPAPDSPALRRLGVKDLVGSALGLVVAGLLIAYGLPFFLDTSWAEIGQELARTTWTEALLMSVLLVAGLFCYTWVLIGSLPGLGHVQALKVNAVTSLVANLLPLGAAVGVALMVVMCRSWGFTRRAISASLVVTSLWNLLARIALPVVGCLTVIASPLQAPRVVVNAAVVAGAVGTAVIVLATLMVFSDPLARRVVQGLDRVAGLLRRSGGRVRRLEQLITDQRGRVESIVRERWLPMTLGMSGQFVLLFGLYWVAARTVGVEIPVYALICAYTFRQLLTLLAVTPGGLGVTEVGTAGLLVILGANAGAASATALLYAIFAHLVVIPFGIAALATWWYGPDRLALLTRDDGPVSPADG